MVDEHTQRGFGVYARFKDGYGNIIRIQESSNVYGGIWIFCNPDPDNPHAITDPSPHLTLENAETVIKALQEAIKHQKNSDRIWSQEDKKMFEEAGRELYGKKDSTNTGQ